MAHPENFNYTTDLFADHAIAWLRARKVGHAPSFFLYLSFTVPHAGGWGSAPAEPENGNPVPTDLGYGLKPWPEVERDHAASIGYLDQKVGGVLQALAEVHLEDSTVVLYAAARAREARSSATTTVVARSSAAASWCPRWWPLPTAPQLCERQRRTQRRRPRRSLL